MVSYGSLPAEDIMKISTWKGDFLLLVSENIVSGHKKRPPKAVGNIAQKYMKNNVKICLKNSWQ